MNYLLTNVHKEYKISINKKEWLHILGIACQQGWRPQGTTLTYTMSVQVCSTEGISYLSMDTNSTNQHWNGSYTQAAGQIVSEIDILGLLQALENNDLVSERFRSFLEQGAFSIAMPEPKYKVAGKKRRRRKKRMAKVAVTV